MATYDFVNWTDSVGNVIGTSPTLNLLVSGDTTIIANYQPRTGTLQVITHPSGASFTANGQHFSAPYGPEVWTEGDVAIVFNDLDGRVTPQARTVHVSQGVNTLVDVTYDPIVMGGVLNVRTEDSLGNLVDGPIFVNGAQVATRTFQQNYLSGTSLTVGFGMLMGYNLQTQPRQVTIVEGQMITVVGVYTPKTPSRWGSLPWIGLGVVGLGAVMYVGSRPAKPVRRRRVR